MLVADRAPGWWLWPCIHRLLLFGTPRARGPDDGGAGTCAPAIALRLGLLCSQLQFSFLIWSPNRCDGTVLVLPAKEKRID
jgi:hypothetical protein